MTALPASDRRRVDAVDVAFGVVWLLVTAALQWSVVRFRVAILLTLSLAAVLLAVALVRRLVPDLGSRVQAFVLLGSVAVLWLVPLFSYLRGGWLTAALLVVSVTGVGCAGLVRWRPRSSWLAEHGAYAVLGIALLGHVAVSVVAILGDRAPKIDVWVVLQQASDALGRGENFYDATWSDSPGVKDLHPYLPWMTVLLAPGRWLAGDVRWALLVWSLVLLACVAALGWRGRAQKVAGADGSDGAHGSDGGEWAAAVGVTLLVVVPGTITQIDQAWTEPLLAALIAMWALLMTRGWAWWAIVPLALACASKQHLALVVPLLMLWHAFGWRRVLATGGLTAVLISPWVVANPSAFVHDTVTGLLSFHPIRFANTWYLFFLNEVGISLPFWITGVVVLGALGGACWAVWRRQPDLGEVLRWAALVLLAANLVNKQAFYNQFWLSLALVIVSLAIPRERPAAAATPR